MYSLNSDLSYELQLKGFEVKEGIKKHAVQIIRDLRRWTGQQADVRVVIDKEVARKKVFSVALAVDGIDEPLKVKKRGKNLITTLKKVKRIAQRKLIQNRSRRQKARRPRYFENAIAS